MTVVHPSVAVRATSAQLAAAAERVLAGIAGPGALPRPDQLAAAAALAVDGRRALVVQATGWGKSAVYWMAAAALRDAGGGPTLVVSPLLALMRNQVEAAQRSGLRAATMNSANVDDWDQVRADLAADRVDVLLTSPERLANPRFAAEVLPWLIARVGLLVIDEAHCISSWGHDFRPDYRRITSLLTDRPDLPVLATTATANDRVTRDVAGQLGAQTLVLRGTLARASLHLTALPRLGQVEAFAWVDQFLPALPGSGIVYAATVRSATDLAGFLTSRGHNVRAYHGQLETGEREEIEELLRANRLTAVVATSALGMGYDKPDLGFVVHIGSPGSPVDYYQQVGRAGRALDTAHVVLVPTPADDALWRYFATASIPRAQDADAVLATLAAAGEPLSVPRLAAATGVRDNRLELLLKVLAVDGAVRRTADGWEATGTPWSYDHQRYAELTAAREHEAALMREYARSHRCLDAVLREALDDPADGACGRCSVCTGSLPEPLAAQPDPEHVAAAYAYLREVDNTLNPRGVWAPGLRWTGRIPPALALRPGRALAFADDPVWPQAAGLVAAPDAPPPPWVVDAVVAVLSRWRTQWAGRPTVVVPVPSSRHPQRVRGIAEQVAAIGRIPVLHALSINGRPGADDLSAKARAAAQAPRLALADGVGPDDLVGEVVLLVDDTWRTGWTATICAALLREAGADAVLPLVVHHQP